MRIKPILTTLDDFKRQAEITGISLSMWACVQEEYADEIAERRANHKKVSHLIAEWEKIDAYYTKLLNDEMDILYLQLTDRG